MVFLGFIRLGDCESGFPKNKGYLALGVLLRRMIVFGGRN